jgi:hypothetical protein
VRWDRLGRRRRSLELQAGILPKDPLVHRLHLGRGQDPEILVEDVAQPSVCGERLRLSAGTVEREHAQCCQMLAHRMPGDETIEGGEHVGATESELGLHP